MKSKFVFLAGLLAATLVIAGCATKEETPEQPDQFLVPENQTAPAAQTAAPAPAPAPESVSVTVETEEIDLVTAPAPAKKAVAKKAAAKPVAKTAAKPAAKPAAKAETETVYTVKNGDTLGAIAIRNGLSASALASYNGISQKSILRIGQKIRIPIMGKHAAAVKKTDSAKKPAPAVKKETTNKNVTSEDEVVYTVKQNDTVSRIAARHHVSIKSITERNNLSKDDLIRVGQKLVIPKSSSSAKTAAAPKKAAVKTAAKAAVREQPKKAAAIKQTAPASGDAAAVASKKAVTADDLIGSGDAFVNNGPAAAPAVSAAPAAAPVASAEAMEDTIAFNCPADMTLQEVADSVGRDYESLKRVNPNLSTTEKLKAGTVVRVNLF